MLVFSGIAEIFLVVLIEGSLAARRAEVIGLSFVFRGASGSGGINIHVADGVMNNGCHKWVSFIFHGIMQL